MHMNRTNRAPVGFAGRRGRFWTFIASWFVPAIMVLAYLVLAVTSQTDATGWAWMSVGLGFALCSWWMVRLLSRSAAMARAIAVGDAERVFELAGSSPLHRGVGHALRGQWSLALAELGRAAPSVPRDHVLVAAVTVGALVELGQVAQARVVLDRELGATGPLARLNPRLDAGSHVAARLARGSVLTAEHRHSEALALLQQVIDDIRTSPASRALAHHYAMQASARAGELAASDRHRSQAAMLAPGSWFANELP
jgi:hypothetical protein